MDSLNYDLMTEEEFEQALARERILDYQRADRAAYWSERNGLGPEDLGDLR